MAKGAKKPRMQQNPEGKAGKHENLSKTKPQVLTRSRSKPKVTVAMPNENQNMNRIDSVPKRKVAKNKVTSTVVRKIMFDEMAESSQVRQNKRLPPNAMVNLTEVQPSVSSMINFEQICDNNQNGLNETEVVDMLNIDKHVSDGVNVHIEGDDPFEDGEEELDYEDVPNPEILDEASAERAPEQTEEEKFLQQNPQLQKLFDHYLDKKLQNVQANSDEGKMIQLLKKAGNGEVQVQQRRELLKDKPRENTNIVKSPSDTTIYAPALQKPKNVIATSRSVRNEIGKFLSNEARQFPGANVGTHESQISMVDEQEIVPQNSNTKEQLIDRITRFVESIRMEQQEEDVQQPSTSGARRNSEVIVPGFDQAQNKSENTVIEAEKFKAKVAEPPGMLMSDLAQMQQFLQSLPMNLGSGVPQNNSHTNIINPVVGSGLSDDDFFHLTCHIDEALKLKIEKGQFVDLDRLLPKEKLGGF